MFHAQRLMKSLHTVGAIGMTGAMACLLAMFAVIPPTNDIARYATMRSAMDAIARYVFLPSVALTLVAGLLAIAINRRFHNAGWVGIKLISGILVFEWGFVAIQGPMQQEAEAAAKVAAGTADAAMTAALGMDVGAQQTSLWVLLAVAAANVVLGVWRPRLTNLRD